MNKWIRIIAIAIGASTLLGYGLACNTTEGLGKDTKAAGQGLQDAADRNK